MTNTETFISAAQYLRMSTEHQQYSFDNQRAAICAYAAKAGFRVIQTYSDAGKSGVVLKSRDGLGQLLNDVISGVAQYKAILVYDVSRWGRFQDVDEAAHYEFLCKAAGITIHYCAEQFVNDNSLSSFIIKALKRIMAGEYSRELSVKVHDGTKRISQSGFRTGGMPGYGLRRTLVSATREPKCILLGHDRKALQSDRVILVPGPDEEVKCVQDIFRMFIKGKKLPSAIAADLRRRGVAYNGLKRKTWYGAAVSRLLKNPKYCGCSVFGQSTFRLHTRKIAQPRNSWIITKGAYIPLVSQDTFDLAQKRIADLSSRTTDVHLLEGLRKLLIKRGSLSQKLVNRASNLPSIEPYVRRFGSLSEAFYKVGFVGPRLETTRARRSVRILRDQLLAQIVATDPNRIAIIQPDRHFRPKLRVSSLLVSVFLCRCVPKGQIEPKWILNPVPREKDCIALIARLNAENEEVIDLFVVPDTRGQVRYQFTTNDPWLYRGRKLDSLADFVSIVEQVSRGG